MDALRRLVRELSGSARGLPVGARVSGAQRFVLRQIEAAPGISLTDLAQRTLAGQSTVSEVVARLVARGLVSRRPRPDDARSAGLTLTASGRRLVADGAPTAQERLAAGLERLGAAGRTRLARGLEQWLDAAGLAGGPAPMFFEATGRARGRATRRG